MSIHIGRRDGTGNRSGRSRLGKPRFAIGCLGGDFAPTCRAATRLILADVRTSAFVFGAWQSMCAGAMFASSSGPPHASATTCSTCHVSPVLIGRPHRWQTPLCACQMRRRRDLDMRRVVMPRFLYSYRRASSFDRKERHSLSRRDSCRIWLGSSQMPSTAIRSGFRACRLLGRKCKMRRLDGKILEGALRPERDRPRLASRRMELARKDHRSATRGCADVP